MTRARESFRRLIFQEALPLHLPVSIMYDLVQFVARKMAVACMKNPTIASGVIWLGYTHWRTLVRKSSAFVLAQVGLSAELGQALVELSLTWHHLESLN